MSLTVGLGAVQAWNHRFAFSSEDIVSYLDIADAYLRAEWSSTINGMWSPLYSWLLALAQAALNWPPAWDACRVKLVNFIAFLAALLCFRFFLYQLLLFRMQRARSSTTTDVEVLPEWLLTIGGYVLLLWSTLRWIGLYCDTPDMSTAALVYLACGLLLRLQARGESLMSYAALGLILGLGYLSKAALFPLAFVFLAAALRMHGGFRRSAPRVLLALFVFALTAGPYVTALSLAKKRFTYGDAGKLSYVYWVDAMGGRLGPDHHWQGGDPEYGKPIHPTRQLHLDPALFEFATPIGGTYPPWTDVSYWFEGIRVRFSLIKAWPVIQRNLAFYCKSFLACLIAGFLLLAFAGGRPGSSAMALGEKWRVLLPAAAGIAIYLTPTDFAGNDIPLQPSMRYIAPFVVVLFATAFAAVRVSSSRFARRLVAALACIELLLAGLKLGPQITLEIKRFARQKVENLHWQTAQLLSRRGISPGDRVAIVGAECDHEYWARLARVKIIAHIPDIAAFEAVDSATRASVFRLVESTGASALVWRQVDGSYLVHLFRATE